MILIHDSFLTGSWGSFFSLVWMKTFLQNKNSHVYKFIFKIGVLEIYKYIYIFKQFYVWTRPYLLCCYALIYAQILLHQIVFSEK